MGNTDLIGMRGYIAGIFAGIDSGIIDEKRAIAAIKERLIESYQNDELLSDETRKQRIAELKA